MDRKYAECLKDMVLTGNTDLATVLIDLEQDKELALVGSILLAAEKVEPKKWQKLVAKIPGICSFATMQVRVLDWKLAYARSLLAQYKKAEKAGDEKKMKDILLKIHKLVKPGEGSLKDFLLYGGSVKKDLKKIVTWIKTGEIIKKMREDQQAVRGLKEACRRKK